MNFKILFSNFEALSDKTNRKEIGQEMTEKKQTLTFWARTDARTHTRTEPVS